MLHSDFLFSGFQMQLTLKEMDKKQEDTDDKKKALFSCKDGIAGAGNCDAATRTKSRCSSKKDDL